MKKLHGIVPALLTPYDANGKVDLGSLQKLTDSLVKEGVDGFYACGSTGEAFLLTEQERMDCVSAIVEAAKGRAFVIAHVGCISTDQTVRLAKHAEKAGADAVSSCAPFYYKFSADEIMRHYLTIADAIELPLVCYNFPAMTGFTLTVDMVEKLNKGNSRINAVKNTTIDMYHMERLKTRIPDLTVYSGHDEVFLSGLVVGADGAIGSTFNFMAKLFLLIRKLAAEQRVKEALEVQRDANYMIDLLIKIGVFPSLKAILRNKGLIQNGCRAPFTDATPEQEKELMTAFEKHVMKYYK